MGLLRAAASDDAHPVEIAARRLPFQGCEIHGAPSMIASFGKKPGGQRLARMKASSRWIDGAFQNVQPILPGLRSGTMPGLGEFLSGGGRKVPVAPLPSVDPREAWTRRVETGLRATWLGHSTVLLEIDGFRVLTDPVWGQRVSPSSLVGPKRFQPVPITVAQLPNIDVVLISHDHYDHLDHSTILALAQTDVPFVTPLGVGAHLEAWGVPSERITELDWWESLNVPGTGLTVTATPSQHFSGRGIGMRNSTLWTSFAVQGPTRSFFFSGDTGLTKEYAAIRQKFGVFDLVMLEVGAYHPAWGDIHLGPANALEALDLLDGGSLLPVHWGTFKLAVHAWDEPAETLLELAPQRGTQLVMPRLGDPVEPSRIERTEPWWRPTAALEKGSVRTATAEEEPSLSSGAASEAAVEWPAD